MGIRILYMADIRRAESHTVNKGLEYWTNFVSTPVVVQIPGQILIADIQIPNSDSSSIWILLFRATLYQLNTGTSLVFRWQLLL